MNDSLEIPPSPDDGAPDASSPGPAPRPASEPVAEDAAATSSPPAADPSTAPETPPAEAAAAAAGATEAPPPTEAEGAPAGANADAGNGQGPGGRSGNAPAKRNGDRQRAKASPSDAPTAMIRYGLMKRIALFGHNQDPPPRRGQKVVVRTERGVELGEVIATVCAEAESGDPGCISCRRLSEVTAGTRGYHRSRQSRILRLAGPQDLNDQVHLDRAGEEKLTYCRQQAREMGLKMKLVAVEHLLGGERVIFYFTAESRVDFRQLVRNLASQYRTRIEMRQVGARDEARLVADYERCGQHCCCRQFLGELQPVSIRMAKTQKATLDPSKISGRCGRLMCCLRYEDAEYERLRKTLPKKGIWVRTDDDQVLRVLATQILTQLVKVADVRGAIRLIENESIVERNVPAPPPPEPRSTAPREPRRRPKPAAKPKKHAESAGEPDSQPVEAPAGTEAAPTTAQPGEKAPREGRSRRRRRRPKRPGQSQASRQGAPASGGQSRPQQQSGQRKKKKRRRRKRGGGNTGGDGGGQQPA